MKILAIETSCDETSAAIIENSQVLSNVVSSQYFHSKYGGVVPELASRAHLHSIVTIVKNALNLAHSDINEISAIAVTTQPGLIGSLIVGANFAKGLGLRYNIPVVPINHIEGHIYSGMIENEEINFPYISLVVSGGHTALFYVESFLKYQLIGTTIDDAAGEAFDKTAKLLGLGYPGGPLIDKFAKDGDPNYVNFPRAMINSGDYNFSFSGLKTAVKNYINKNFPDGVNEKILTHICASIQEAIVDVLVIKAIKAAIAYSSKYLVVAGGVSANSLLRRKFAQESALRGIKFIAPSLSYCIDNAAMIGFLAEKKIINATLDDFKRLDFTTKAYTLKNH